MNLSRLSAIFIRQLFLFKANPTRLAGIFVWLLIDIIQWGFISKYLGSLGEATFSFTTVILGAIILWGFMTRIQQGIMMAFLEDIWSQNFINFFASPLTIREYLGGLVATSLITGLAGFLAMTALSGLLFGYNVFRLGFLILPFMVILLIFGMAMGIFISAMIFRLGPSAEWLGWPIPMLLSIVAGVYYPVSTLPEALRIVALAVPPSYVFESMRTLVTTGVFSGPLLSHLFAGALLSAVYLLLASLFFVRIYRANLVSGSIARFNAETL